MMEDPVRGCRTELSSGSASVDANLRVAPAHGRYPWSVCIFASTEETYPRGRKHERDEDLLQPQIQ